MSPAIAVVAAAVKYCHPLPFDFNHGRNQLGDITGYKAELNRLEKKKERAYEDYSDGIITRDGDCPAMPPIHRRNCKQSGCCGFRKHES